MRVFLILEAIECVDRDALLHIPHFHHTSRPGASVQSSIRAEIGIGRAFLTIMLECVDCLTATYFEDRDVPALIGQRQIVFDRS